MKIIDVTEKDFKEEVINSKTPVLIDFNADWCGPCRMLRPILDEISEEVENIKIVSINVDKNDNLAREYGVMSIPCLVFVKNGKEEKRSIGLISKDEVKKIIGVN